MVITELSGVIVLLVLQFCFAKGALHQPIAYTLPDGLRSVNGSNITGGCQESCVMMPISGTSINGCDCPGSTTPASGVLIDGDIPSVDTTQHGTWASGLFVVNRNGQDSFMIGFQFLSAFHLRGVEIIFFNCPVQGIGISTINVYSSYLFPSFIAPAASRGGSLDIILNDNCNSLSVVSIAVQLTDDMDKYFIEFIFTAGPSINVLNWLSIGEIRFSDETPMIPVTDEITTNDGE